MSLQELKTEVFRLSVSARLELVQVIISSVESELRFRPNRKVAIERMRGLAKTDATPPTNAKVEAMLEERLVETYLQ